MQRVQPFALFDDATWPDRTATLLSEPQGLIQACCAEEVASALAAIEDAAARGLFAAGFMAYELGYAFEKRLAPLMPDRKQPLLRFHLFSRRQRLSAGERARWLS